jgi:hypothetical protein
MPIALANSTPAESAQQSERTSVRPSARTRSTPDSNSRRPMLCRRASGSTVTWTKPTWVLSQCGRPTFSTPATRPVLSRATAASGGSPSHTWCKLVVNEKTVGPTSSCLSTNRAASSSATAPATSRSSRRSASSQVSCTAQATAIDAARATRLPLARIGRQIEMLTGKVAIHATVPTKMTRPKPSSTRRRRGVPSFVLIPARRGRRRKARPRARSSWRAGCWSSPAPTRPAPPPTAGGDWSSCWRTTGCPACGASLRCKAIAPAWLNEIVRGYALPVGVATDAHRGGRQRLGSSPELSGEGQ